MTNLFLGL